MEFFKDNHAGRSKLSSLCKIMYNSSVCCLLGRLSKCLMHILLKHNVAQESKWEIMYAVSWNKIDKLRHTEESWYTSLVKNIQSLITDFIYIWCDSSEKLNKLLVETNASLTTLFCEMGNKHPSSPCHHSWVLLNCLHLSGKYSNVNICLHEFILFSHSQVILHFCKYLAAKQNVLGSSRIKSVLIQPRQVI